jgi:hypothetical protein
MSPRKVRGVPQPKNWLPLPKGKEHPELDGPKLPKERRYPPRAKVAQKRWYIVSIFFNISRVGRVGWSGKDSWFEVGVG